MKLVRRLNQPLPPGGSARGHALLEPGAAGGDDWLVLLAFSGGGTRAAALSYGVLEELARTRVNCAGRPTRMLDKVDAISAVSGGSFTAAYYALNGDGLFRDFDRLFLKRDVQGALWRKMVWPPNWIPLMSKQLGRSDLAADFYDESIFDGARFGDLLKVSGRPNLILNATDMVTGRPFAFTQRFFDLIGSDITSLPLGRAVAASSAAPLVLSPLTLRNYSDAERLVECTEYFRGEARAGGAPQDLTESLITYLDAEDRPFIHLVDGGVSDNLGLRGLLDRSAMSGGLDEMLKGAQLGHVRKVAIVVVNAAAHHESRWNHGSHPDVVDVLQAVSERATQLSSARTLSDLKYHLEAWRVADGIDGAGERDYHLVEVNFEHVADPVERRFFHELPTALSLPGKTVERLVEVGGRLLRESAAWKKFLAAFETAGASRVRV